MLFFFNGSHLFFTRHCQSMIDLMAVVNFQLCILYCFRYARRASKMASMVSGGEKAENDEGNGSVET